MEEDYIYLPRNTVLKNEYKIEDRLAGRTGLSIVYLARRTKDNENVVIKEFFPKNLALRDLDKKNIVPRQKYLKDRYQAEKDKFLQEGKILKNINKEGICKCYEFFKEYNTGYIVMEYYNGINLKEYLKRNISVLEFFEKIYFPLLETVHKLHQEGYIHRDIKPQNVLMYKDRPILLDFGSAVSYKSQEKKHIALTPGFAPIELHSESSNQGIHSDIYSLSSILYYYFTKKKPVAAKKRVIEDNLPRVKELNQDLSDFLDNVIMKNLSMDYKERDESIPKHRMKLRFEYYKEKISRRLLG